MNPRNTAIKDLNNSGYQFKRSGGNHDIYYNPQTKLFHSLETRPLR